MRKTFLAFTVTLAVMFASFNASPASASYLDKKDKSKKEKEKKTDDASASTSTSSSDEKAKEKSEKKAKEKAEKKAKAEKPDKGGNSKSLYARLGGKKAITTVIDDFVGFVAADTRINKFFADTAKDPARLASFKQKLVDQVCEATGGPCKYTGLDMKTAHKGLGITDADFNALVEDLVKALDKNNVGATEKQEILTALGSMKADIVGQ